MMVAVYCCCCSSSSSSSLFFSLFLFFFFFFFFFFFCFFLFVLVLVCIFIIAFVVVFVVVRLVCCGQFPSDSLAGNRPGNASKRIKAVFPLLLAPSHAISLIMMMPILLFYHWQLQSLLVCLGLWSLSPLMRKEEVF